MNLRKFAEGKPCMVRIPKVCRQDPQTVNLSHIRRGHVAGASQKPADLCAVWACSRCHDVIDRRNWMGAYTLSEIDVIIYTALCRQLRWYVEHDVLDGTMQQILQTLVGNHTDPVSDKLDVLCQDLDDLWKRGVVHG